MSNVNKKNEQTINQQNPQISIFIGSDHAGYELKQQVVKYLNMENYNVVDVGCDSIESVDYPDYAIIVANNVNNSIKINKKNKGILICGTGSGMAITANKIGQIRAVNCFTPEMAEMAIKHNDAHILCLGARILNYDTTINIIKAFLDSEFEGVRHQKRIDKINAIVSGI